MLPVRLRPGDELRAALDRLSTDWPGGFVVSGIGSLSVARLRLAGCSEAFELSGDLELLTLSGTLTPDGSHLHATVADAEGRVFGGHVLPGCIVRTTAEVLLLHLEVPLARAHDPETGYAELVVG